MATLSGLTPPFPPASGTTDMPVTSKSSAPVIIILPYKPPINPYVAILLEGSTFPISLASVSCFGISVTSILALHLYQNNTKHDSLPCSAHPNPPSHPVQPVSPEVTPSTPRSFLPQHLTSHPGLVISSETCSSHRTFSTSIFPAAIA